MVQKIREESRAQQQADREKAREVSYPPHIYIYIYIYIYILYDVCVCVCVCVCLCAVCVCVWWERFLVS
jgi:hypothetical protein